MTKTKLLIEETADVIQGISILGRGAGARPGGWPLEMVEISDFKDSSWLNSDRLKSEEAYGSSVEAAHIRRSVLRDAIIGQIYSSKASNAQATNSNPRPVTKTENNTYAEN